ncbi:MAG TPA: hypothetical protein EYP35_01335, partial [Desulfobacterales bacterium]|nr:hypothetical protein [Desulfobacterales bacterium]
MVTRHVAFYVRQAVAGEKPGHVPGSLIAFIGYPATMRKLVLRLVNETLNGTAPVAGIKVEAFVPEYGFKTAAVSGQDGLVVLNVPAPAKAVYIVIHNYGLCSLLIIKNFKYSVYQYNYGIVMLNYLTWGVCPEFKGTGIILMNSTVSLMGRLWVPIEGLNLLGLFEDHGRLLFLGYRGNNLVIVVKKGLEQHVYEYVLPSKPVSVVMSPDSKFIIIGCKNGEVFVIDASKMKFVWAGLFGLGEIASIDVCIINGHYLIATYDMKGRVSIGVTTPNGVRLTAYADLGSLPRPFPHLEFWEDKLLVSSKNGYAVINGIDKLVTSFGNLLKRTVKGVLVEAFSEKGEPVKAEVSIYYNGNHITTITTPAVAPLLLGAHYTVVIKPLQKHYADTKTVIYVSATAKAKRVNVSVPYKNYTLTLSVFDPYGVQENLTVYVNGSKVATLYAGGNS